MLLTIGEFNLRRFEYIALPIKNATIRALIPQKSILIHINPHNPLPKPTNLLYSLYIGRHQTLLPPTILYRHFRKGGKRSQLKLNRWGNRTIWGGVGCVGSVGETIVCEGWVLLAGLVQGEVLEGVPEGVVGAAGLGHWAYALLVGRHGLWGCGACVRCVLHVFAGTLFTCFRADLLYLACNRHCLLV